MPVPNFHRNHAQHISASEKLSEELKKTGEDILSQISNLNQKISDKFLIKVINGIVGGIYAIVPDLQEIVIKSNHENQNNAVLKDMLQKLSQYCNEMVQGYDSVSTTLKIKFHIFIKNILLDAERLLNIIKNDNLHDFKHELVECLKEIMLAIHLGQVRMKIESCSKEELKILIEKQQKEYFENIAIVEKCSFADLKAIAVNVKYNVKYTLKLAYHYNKVASNYDDIDIQRKILDAGAYLNSVSAIGILDIEKATDNKEAHDILKQLCIQGWDTVKEVFEFNDLNNDNKSSETLRELSKLAVAYGFVLTNNLGTYVNHDCAFASL